LELAASCKKVHRLVFALDRYIGRHSAHNNNNKHLKSRTNTHKGKKQKKRKQKVLGSH
jgi:hypothetical protein